MRDGSIDNAAMLAYLQRLAEKMVTAAGGQPIQVRITGGAEEYALITSNRVFYISGRLLDGVEDEAQLAGLMAHLLAHRGLREHSCVLGSPVASSWPGDVRGHEEQAIALAISIQKSAGYDPAAMLDFFSKLAYEHPVWAKAINPDDLLDLSLRLESETVPRNGYRVDSSAFLEFHATMTGILGKGPAKAGIVLRSDSAWR